MKIKTSMKNIRDAWNKKFRCGYCDLQYIMKGEEPAYYNCGVYGWNCDVYVDWKNDIAITTGYRNMIGKRIPDELLTRYTENAKKIMENMWEKPYDEYMEELEKNRKEFFEELNKL